jgi:FMN-dependent NADH-azoreductase
MNILQINSSIYSGDGQSSRIADQIVTRLRAANPA